MRGGEGRLAETLSGWQSCPVRAIPGSLCPIFCPVRRWLLTRTQLVSIEDYFSKLGTPRIGVRPGEWFAVVLTLGGPAPDIASW